MSKEEHVFKPDALIRTATNNEMEVTVRMQGKNQREFTAKILTANKYEVVVERKNGDAVVLFRHAIAYMDFAGLRTHDIDQTRNERNTFTAEALLDHVLVNDTPIDVQVFFGDDIKQVQLTAKSRYEYTFSMEGKLRLSSKSNIITMNMGPRKNFSF